MNITANTEVLDKSRDIAEAAHAVDEAMRAANAALKTIRVASEKCSVNALTAASGGDHAAAEAAFHSAKALADEMDRCIREFANGIAAARIAQEAVHDNVASTAEYALYRAADKA